MWIKKDKTLNRNEYQCRIVDSTTHIASQNILRSHVNGDLLSAFALGVWFFKIIGRLKIPHRQYGQERFFPLPPINHCL